MSSYAQEALHRIVDANANRALEGLRVCEEIVRFHLESPTVFRQMRGLRHAIAHALATLPVSAHVLVRSRASGRDIGKRAPASRIDSLERLLVINFQRVKESLRTLEECSRLLSPRHTGVFQRLRFQVYEVERDTLLTLATLRHS